MFSNHKFIAFETIVVREIRRFTRIWLQTIVPPAITIGLYFVIFGNLVGRRIGEMGGYQYMDFIIPGLIMMAVIQNSYSNVVSSFFSHKFQKSIEEVLVSPVPNYVILSGFIVGGMARGLAVGAIVTVMAIIFSDMEIQYPLITISVVLMTSIVFSLAGFINALFANSFDDISIIPTFVLTPLIYLGGVFYSSQLLPQFWQVVSKMNPIFYMVNTFRYGILGTSDVDITWAFMMLGVFIVILYSSCIFLLRKGTGLRS
ncbi:MAG: ABC transporter permease [Gammaproteobacteria bacterium]|jgi:ABC-2 type transport system permease protein|nr:ABC transporter permease [Gammaproteobacteria bacterium]MBT3860692.1 ABC transporter permease [Gammaproteobacteria bacterium]MBT3988326.1 ABC transporter permease [Gammaproteobacteria bacterium]MBT4254621.1 ABC transporter permease [Gammaproteobacteria bacterium]MBT4581982.1 ABC transporter permease [Gammaproteobacteria bacterium]